MSKTSSITQFLLSKKLKNLVPKIEKKINKSRLIQFQNQINLMCAN